VGRALHSQCRKSRFSAVGSAFDAVILYEDPWEKSDKRHTYLFKLYALDTKLDLSQGSSKKQIEEAMKGHILDETVLKGSYSP